jgi:transcriptional regulator with XRE-family HTH domain
MAYKTFDADSIASQKLKQIGLKVRLLRQARGWTQKELTQHMGLVSPITISHVESGSRNFNINTLVRLSLALEVDIAEFFHD